MIDSEARPAPTVEGNTELVRSWRPEGDPWAEVIIVHGLGEHSGRYERTGSLLAEQGLGVRSFDLIGFGASSGRRGHADDWTFYLDQTQQHVEAARQQDSPLVLLGHSLGGLIALEYCLAARPHPDALVLSAPALGGGRKWQGLVAPLAAALVPRVRVPNQIRGDQLSRDPAVGEAYFEDPLVYTRTSTRLGAEIFAAVRRCREHLHDLDVPTLVLHGGLDSLVPPQLTAGLERLPNVERILYPTLRHEVFNEPEGPEVLGDVVRWLKGRFTTSG